CGAADAGSTAVVKKLSNEDTGFPAASRTSEVTNTWCNAPWGSAPAGVSTTVALAAARLVLCGTSGPSPGRNMFGAHLARGRGQGTREEQADGVVDRHPGRAIRRAHHRNRGALCVRRADRKCALEGRCRVALQVRHPGGDKQ